MSLTEEIFLKLAPYSPPENDRWDANITDEIIEIIEKRINDRIDSYHKLLRRNDAAADEPVYLRKIIELQEVKKILLFS